MQINYVLMLPNSFGPIHGATAVYRNGFIPPSKEYRMHIEVEDNDYVEFDIADDEDAMIFDPKGKWVEISLCSNEYLIPDQKELTEENYNELCKDLIFLAKHHGWILFGDKEKAPEEIKKFFATKK